MPRAVSLGLKQCSCPPRSSSSHRPGERQGPPTGQTSATPALPPHTLYLSHRMLLPFSLNMISTTTGQQGAWAEAGLQTCLVWLSIVLQKNLNQLPTLKSQISHKNPDFWLLFCKVRKAGNPESQRSNQLLQSSAGPFRQDAVQVAQPLPPSGVTSRQARVSLWPKLVLHVALGSQQAFQWGSSVYTHRMVLHL